MARQILVLHGKHGDSYFDVPDSAALDNISLEILTQRFNEGYWYDKDYEFYAAIKLCVENQRAVDAYFLLRRRSDEGYEYERISLKTLEGVFDGKDR